MEFGGSGDPTQQDCVDEATNTTSYLLVLQAHGLLKHHTVGIPMTKGNLLEGDVAGGSGEILAALDRGHPGEEDRPEICRRFLDRTARVKTLPLSRSKNWYIKDINNLPKATN